jgi:hypothetical protein
LEGDGIFLIRDGNLILLQQKPYDSEAILQEALASFPDVLAGGSTAGGSACRLLLVRREIGVPKTEGGAANWSLDHLFVDADGVPVVVEVKRSSDTRIRREVIGQMLDYAANAVVYWPLSELRAAFDATAAEAGVSGDERIKDLLPQADPETFWQLVGENLKAGRVRMIFVADRLPPELVRVIEFLNEQMSPAEVLGVEVPQYVGSDHQVLVPRIIGRTATAVATKQTGGKQWDEDGFLSAVMDHHGDIQAAFFRRLFEHVRQHGQHFSWGRGVSPGVSGWYKVAEAPMALWTANAGIASPNARPSVYVYLPEIKLRSSPLKFELFVDALASIPAYKPKIKEAKERNFEGKYPSVSISDLVSAPQQVDRFLAALNGLVDSVDN